MRWVRSIENNLAEGNSLMFTQKLDPRYANCFSLLDIESQLASALHDATG